MNKADFINSIASKTGMTKVDARKAYEAFVETTHEELKAGNKVSLLGFGTFSVNERPARKGVNPATGKKISIAAKKSIKFKAGKGMEL